MIKEASVTVMVSDMKRAIKFYVEIVGLNLKANWGDEFAQIKAPGDPDGNPLYLSQTSGWD